MTGLRRCAYLLCAVLAACSLVLVGCGDDDGDNVTGPGGTYPAELFPGLQSEVWYFFVAADTTFHHYEIFEYQYDAQGRRTRGHFYQAERQVHLALTYTYDAQGKPTGEVWDGPTIPEVGEFDWTIQYRYDEAGKHILGGVGTGFYDWEFIYEFDREGRRITTEFRSDSPFAPKFKLYHRYDDEGWALLATGREQRGQDIVILYNYGDTTPTAKLAALRSAVGDRAEAFLRASG